MDKNIFGGNPGNDTLPFYGNGNTSTTFITVPAPATTSLGMARTGDRMLQNAALVTLHENLRASIAKNALDNVAALAALEQHLYQVAPLGEEAYHAIVQAYSISAAHRIIRW